MRITIIGGGLAGCEAAWQAAEMGMGVDLYEMRPAKMTEAHTTPWLAEIVCSNSLGAEIPEKASGLLKAELRIWQSLLLRCAEESRIPAGRALAVDREKFSARVEEAIAQHPNIRVYREEVSDIPDGFCVIASGPLTSAALSEHIQKYLGSDQLFFYDAVAPIVRADTLDQSIIFRASRYEFDHPEEGDYLNCPLNQQQYEALVNALLEATPLPLKSFESEIHSGVRAGSSRYFEACLPIEVMAKRGMQSLAYGPLRPVGIVNPRNNLRPYAVVQLRQDNLAGDLFNLVGFQTNLRVEDQKRIFRIIPGLEQAEFVRYGQMHRNTFIAAPLVLLPTLQTKMRQDLFFAGQITGIEGYMGNIASGLVAGMNAARLALGKPLLQFPRSTMLGGLMHYISNAAMDDFQPMKANYGLLPPLVSERKINKKLRFEMMSDRALDDMQAFYAINR